MIVSDIFVHNFGRWLYLFFLNLGCLETTLDVKTIREVNDVIDFKSKTRDMDKPQ